VKNDFYNRNNLLKKPTSYKGEVLCPSMALVEMFDYSYVHFMTKMFCLDLITALVKWITHENVLTPFLK